ncbi:MAG: Flp pilus assembly protein CpaB [Planctomycetaceae bacterium]
MKPKTVILLAVAVGCGLLAMLGVQQAMSGSNTVTAEETVKVLVAMDSISPGVALSEQNVEFREIAASAVPPDKITTVEEYDKRSALFPFQKGDIVRLSKLTEKGGGGRSYQIPKGQRVIAISVTASETNSGLLQPGDRVDVAVTYSSRDRSGRQMTKTMTLLEYVEVFATDARTVNDTADAKAGAASTTKHVSLLLHPDQVNYVRLAEAKGQLSLAWRHRDDDVLANVGEVDLELLNDLRGQTINGLDGGAPGYENYLMGEGAAEMMANNTGAYGQAPMAQTTPPPVAPATAPQPADSGAFGLDAMLTQSQPAAVVDNAPAVDVVEVKKNEWTVQIYNGQNVAGQSFEMPEETAEEVKEAESALSGVSKLLNLFGTKK